jgi:hypothetical protein
MHKNRAIIEKLRNYLLKILGIFVSLKTLQNKIIEKSDEKAPSFLLVLTAVGGAYKRDDGVYVAPISLLKP